MKLVAGTALLVAIAFGASACGGSHGVSTERAHLHFPSTLQASLVSYIRTAVKSSDGTVSDIAVYGPGSRTDLVKATSGDYVYMSPKEQSMRFYLVVLSGDFVCARCASPRSSASEPPPHSTVETYVWSAEEGGTDFGASNSAGPGVSHLHRLATITVS